MNATGVAHRRGFAIIVLLAAVALAAWLVQARLSDSTKPKPKPVSGAVPAAAASDAAPAAPADGYGAPAPGGEGYGAPAAPAAPAAAGNFTTTSLIAKTLKRMGNAVADSSGQLLYRFEGDVKGQPSKCENACAAAWPPVVVDDPNKLQLEGIDKSKVSVIPRSDGSKQLAIGDWPVYQFTKNKGAGTWPGQGASNGTWWIIQPTGARNTSCAPAGVPVPS